MKAILTVLSLWLLVSCSASDLQQAGYPPLSEAEVTEALRDALGRSVTLSAAQASRIDGFYADSQLRIELPEGTEKMEKTLRKLGFGKQIDAAVLQMNRAAEAASARAKRVFIKAITAMTIDDAFDILYGDQDAATRYLRDNASDELYDEFEPLVIAALEETYATRAYRQVVERYNALPLVFDVDLDIDEYVTQKTIDGLFVLIAQEEMRIRRISGARSTRLMRRVFGSVD